MRLTNLIILLILMSSFAIGVGITDLDRIATASIFNNATETLKNITLTSEDNLSSPYVNSFLLIVTEYIRFLGTLLFEVVKIGIGFGQDNPEYFEPTFIITLMKFIIWIFIISLLIKPVGWLIAFLIVGIIALANKIKNRKETFWKEFKLKPKKESEK